MAQPKRFEDENLLLSNFYNQAMAGCPAGAKKAIAKANYENKKLRLFCVHCGYNKESATFINATTYIQMQVQQYLNAELCCKHFLRMKFFGVSMQCIWIIWKII